MGLPGVRRVLADLSATGRDGRSSARAGLRLAALETRDWLEDTDECLRALHRADLPSTQRARPGAKRSGDCRVRAAPAAAADRVPARAR